MAKYVGTRNPSYTPVGDGTKSPSEGGRKETRSLPPGEQKNYQSQTPPDSALGHFSTVICVFSGQGRAQCHKDILVTSGRFD